MISNKQKTLTSALDMCRARVPLSGSGWADKFFYLSPESSGSRGRWSSLPFQVAILNWGCDDDIQELVVMKPKRAGFTKIILSIMASSIVQKNRNVGIWQPTDGDAKKFATMDVNTILRDVPDIGKKLVCEVGRKHPGNTIEQKIFHGCALFIRGSQAATNFRYLTLDIAIIDEADGAPLNVEGEGSPAKLAQGRLEAAPFPKLIIGTTPKRKNFSNIEKAIKTCHHIFYRFVKCPHCGTLQPITFPEYDGFESPPGIRIDWNREPGLSIMERAESAHAICVNSCEKIYYRDYPEMDEGGRWQTEDGFYYVEKEDKFYNPLDEPIPKPRKVGVKFWGAYSYLRSWVFHVENWLEAKDAADSGDISALITFVNTTLGLTFEEKGQSVNYSDIARRHANEKYLEGGTIPNEILVITIGADIQGGKNARIELEIVGHGMKYETWSLDYVVIPGDIENSHVWDHLDAQLQRVFKRKDGVSIGVSAAFVDSGYLHTEVYKFTGPRERRSVFATKGVNNGTACNPGTGVGVKNRFKQKGKRNFLAVLHTMNVDEAKTTLYLRLAKEEYGPGYCHFPSHYPESYYKMITAEEKVVSYDKNGMASGYKWIKKSAGEPNEALDCRNYAMGAFARLNPNMAALESRLKTHAVYVESGHDIKTIPKLRQRKIRSRGI